MERWWENFLVDEKKIDLKAIQPEKSIEDLSQEEQMKIYQMMYDQRQKAMGLPTSEEQVLMKNPSFSLVDVSLVLEISGDAKESLGYRRFTFQRSTLRSLVDFFNAKIGIISFFFVFFSFKMEEKHKPFRKSSTGVKAERRKRKKREEEEGTEGEKKTKSDSISLEEAKRRNPKAFSIQNPVSAERKFRR